MYFFFLKDEYGEEDMEGKLRRRDTPHHLKNKRTAAPVTVAGTEPVSAEDKVRAILQNINQNSDQADGSAPQVRFRNLYGLFMKNTLL